MMAGDHLDKMHRGWLLPYLLELDTTDNPEQNYQGHGRWDYWLRACEAGTIPTDPIPQIAFAQHPEREDARHVKDVLQVYVNKGHWYDDAWQALVAWMLHGFGRKGLERDIERIPADIQNVWYELFNLGILLRSPVDWSVVVFTGGLPGMKRPRSLPYEGAGFFPTPINVSKMMTAMTFATMPDHKAKTSSVCDPCCGTGSLLLAASNYSLRLYGVDVVRDLCLCAELNGWLWMPWLVYTPDHMQRLFCELDGEGQPTPPPTIRLEKEPAKVTATEDYRAGKIAQADFFAQLA